MCVCKLAAWLIVLLPSVCVCVRVLRGDREDAAECLDAAGAGGELNFLDP